MNTGEDNSITKSQSLAKEMSQEPNLPTMKSKTKAEAHSVHFAIEGTERVMVQKISMFEPNIGISQVLLSPTASEIEFALTKPWTGHVRKAAGSPTQLIRFGPPATRKRSTPEQDSKRRKSILTNKLSGFKKESKETLQPKFESAPEGSVTSLESTFSKSTFDSQGSTKGTEEGREKKKSRKKVKVEGSLATEEKKVDFKDEKVEERMTMTLTTVVERENVEDKKIKDVDSKETVEAKKKNIKEEASKDSLTSQTDKVKKKKLKSQDIDLPLADSLTSQTERVKKKRLKSQDIDLPSEDSLMSQTERVKKKRLKSQDIDLPSEETHIIKEHTQRKRRKSDEEKEQTKTLGARLRDLLSPTGHIEPRRSLGADLKETGQRKSRDEGRLRSGGPSMDGGRSRKGSRDERPRKSINRGWILNRASIQKKGKSFMSPTQISDESSPMASQRRIQAKSKDDGSNKGDEAFGSEYSSSRFSLKTKRKKAALQQPKPKRFLLPEIPGVTYNRTRFAGWDFGTKRQPTIAVNLPDITDTAPDVIDTIISKSTDPAYDLLFKTRADSLYSDPRNKKLLSGLDPSMRPPEALQTYPGFYAVAKSASKYKSDRKGKAWGKSFIEPLKDFEPILEVRDEQNVLIQNPADLSGTATPLTQETLSSFDMGISKHRNKSPALLAIDKISGKRKPKPAKDLSKRPATRPKLFSSSSQGSQRFAAEKPSTVNEAAKDRKRAPASYLGMADDGMDTMFPEGSDTFITPKSIKVKGPHITPGKPERKKQKALQSKLLPSKLETSEEAIPEMSQISKEKGDTGRATSASSDTIKRPKAESHRRASVAPGAFEDFEADIDVEEPSFKEIDARAKHRKPEISEDPEADIDVEVPSLTKIDPRAKHLKRDVSDDSKDDVDIEEPSFKKIDAHRKHRKPEVSEDSEADINVQQPTFETSEARAELRKPEPSEDSVADIQDEKPYFVKLDERAKHPNEFYEISEDSLVGTGIDKLSSKKTGAHAKKSFPPGLRMKPEMLETKSKPGKKRATSASLSSPMSKEKPHIIITEDTDVSDGQESFPSSSDVSVRDEAFKERTLKETDVPSFQTLLKSDIEGMSQFVESTTTSPMSSQRASSALLAPSQADAFPKLVSEELNWEDKLVVSQFPERTKSQDTMRSPETAQSSDVVSEFDQFSENLQETCINFFNVSKPELVSQKYISEHGIEELLSFLMYAIVMHKPQDPVDFIINLVRSINRLVKLKQLSDRKIRQGRAFRVARLGDHLVSPPRSKTDILGLTSEYISPRHLN